MQSIIKVESLTKTYVSGSTHVHALQGISFELFEGEMLAIMGSSGSGKSTTLNILGALEPPDDGKIYFMDELMENYSIEPEATRIRNRYIGFVFQDFSLLQDLSVRENISLPLILQGKKDRETRELVERIAEKVGLAEKLDAGIGELSGGQQQRVAIARAVIAEPGLLLADEPTGNLDYHTSMEIMDLFLQLKRERGQSILIVTHDPTVAAYADRVIFLHDGLLTHEHRNLLEQDNVQEIINALHP